GLQPRPAHQSVAAEAPPTVSGSPDEVRERGYGFPDFIRATADLARATGCPCRSGFSRDSRTRASPPKRLPRSGSPDEVRGRGHGFPDFIRATG
ncbi:hypothetical protein, partial [Bowmanella yangjiangensis]